MALAICLCSEKQKHYSGRILCLLLSKLKGDQVISEWTGVPQSEAARLVYNY